MAKIPSAPALFIPTYVPPTIKSTLHSVPPPVILAPPTSTGKQKSSSISLPNTPNSNTGKTKTKSSASLNHGSTSTTQSHVKKNQLGQTLNAQGKPINASGHLINDFNQRVNAQGRAINDQHHLVDKQNRLVNKDNILVDPLDRPLDKNGKLARSMDAAAKGDVAPPVGQVIPAVKHAFFKWKDVAGEGNAVAKTDLPVVKNVAELTQRMIDAEKMIKAGVVSTSPGLKRVVGEAAASAAVSGLVSAPISVGAYGASTAWGESIKASYLPVPLVLQAPGTKPLTDHSAAKTSTEVAPATAQSALDPDTEALYGRMDKLQVAAFDSTNNAMAFHHGNFEKGWLPSAEWSADPVQRMGQLEELLDRNEAVTHDIAVECEVFFKPYLPAEEAPEGVAGLASRVDTAERRLSAIDKAQAGIMDTVKARIGKT